MSWAALLFGLCLFSSMAPGQVLRWQNATSGQSVGLSCSGFSCAIPQTTVAPGDAVTLRVTGQLGGADFIAASLGQASCLSVPGILNKLLIDPIQLQLLVPGMLGPPGPIICIAGGTGLDLQTFTWPNIGPGVVFFVQAVSVSPSGSPAFTNAIQVTTT